MSESFIFIIIFKALFFFVLKLIWWIYANADEPTPSEKQGATPSDIDPSGLETENDDHAEDITGKAPLNSTSEEASRPASVTCTAPFQIVLFLCEFIGVYVLVVVCALVFYSQWRRLYVINIGFDTRSFVLTLHSGLLISWNYYYLSDF